MQHIGQLAHRAAQQAHQGQPQARESSPTIRKLFLLLQGTYGNAFLTKFSTGVMDDHNPPRDKGILAAMRTWERTLAKYEPSVIETAADRALEAHKQFAPNLAEFEALCRAAQPRKTHAELAGWTALPAPAKPERINAEFERKGDGKDNYRSIWARHLAGDPTVSLYALRSAIDVLKKAGELK